jgi:hypothetical protein
LPTGTLEIEKNPLMSVAAPKVVPSIFTVAPIMSSLVEASLIVPRTTPVWAKEMIEKRKNVRKEILNLEFIIDIGASKFLLFGVSNF